MPTLGSPVSRVRPRTAWPSVGRGAGTPTVPAECSSLVELLRLRATEQPEAVGFSFSVQGGTELQHITYAQLDEQARGIAAELQLAQLAGQRALLLYPAGLDFLTAFFGCLYAGVVAIPAYPPRRNRNSERIDAVLADAKPSVVLSTEATFTRIGRWTDHDAPLRGLPWWATDRDIHATAEHWQPTTIAPSDLAFLQYTSGSTGDPKGVMLTHRNLLHNAQVIHHGFETTSYDTGVSWLPQYHDMGLIGGILQPLYIGSWTVLMSPTHFLQQPLRWLQLISLTGATVSGGPNFAYQLCVDRISDEAKRGLDLSRWQVAFNGAEPIRATTLEQFADKFADCGFRREAFYPCYGLAESTLLVAGSRRAEPAATLTVYTQQLQQREGGAVEPVDPSAEQATTTLVSSGHPLLDQQVRIVDPEELLPCSDGQVGEIWVTGHSVAAGYWQREETNADTFAAHLSGDPRPFLRTGDLGFVARGELFVTGRLKDLIIIRGVNHYPQDIEQTVAAADPALGHARTAAIAVGQDGQERLVVLQEVPRREAGRSDELLAEIRRRVLQQHDIAPTAIVLVEMNSLPTTSSGKLQRYACRNAYEMAALAEVACWTDPSPVPASPRSPATSSAAPGRPGPAAAGSSAAMCATAEDDIVQGIDAAIRQVAQDRADGMTPETSLVEMGLDSLERMEIVALLEERFNLRFSEESLLDMQTPADVEQVIRHRWPPGEASHRRPPAPEIAPGDYDFAQSPEYRNLQQAFRLAEQTGVGNPYFTEHQGITNDRTKIDGREYLNFCSYNYLGMSGDEYVAAAAQQAIATYGTSVSASRLVSGEKPIHRQLETAIADFLGVEAAISFVGGHATNETTIGHLFGPGDLILHDALSHNSIVQGCRLSGARRRAFPHNDFVACRDLLVRYRSEHRRVLIVIEGVYSMDGDIAPLPEFVELKEEFKTYLMVDEAHSLGTLGEGGRGIASHFDLDPKRVDLWMGTMSKSLASCGGYIAARQELVEYLKYTAPGFVYSVGLPPANAAAALAAIERIGEEPQRVEQLQKNAALFVSLAKQAGLNTGASHGTPIVPVITASSEAAMHLAHRLFRDGVNVQPIVHPAVEEEAARLRFFLTSDHSEAQIRQTVALTARHWQKISGASSAA